MTRTLLGIVSPWDCGMGALVAAAASKFRDLGLHWHAEAIERPRDRRVAFLRARDAAADARAVLSVAGKYGRAGEAEELQELLSILLIRCGGTSERRDLERCSTVERGVYDHERDQRAEGRSG